MRFRHRENVWETILVLPTWVRAASTTAYLSVYTPVYITTYVKKTSSTHRAFKCTCTPCSHLRNSSLGESLRIRGNMHTVRAW